MSNGKVQVRPLAVRYNAHAPTFMILHEQILMRLLYYFIFSYNRIRQLIFALLDISTPLIATIHQIFNERVVARSSSFLSDVHLA